MTTLKTLTMGLNRFLNRLFSDMPETIDYLNGADSLPPPLNKEEEKKAAYRAQSQACGLYRQKVRVNRHRHRGLNLHRLDRAYKGGEHLLS